MKPLQVLPVETVFPHERTELYQRTRELHAFAAQLESTAGRSRYAASLVRFAYLSMLSTASAGVAATERIRARQLSALRDRLARFSSVLHSIADRGFVEPGALTFGTFLVTKAVALIGTFEADLRRLESELLSEPVQAEAEYADIATATADDVSRAEQNIPDTDGVTGSAQGAPASRRGTRRPFVPPAKPVNEEQGESLGDARGGEGLPNLRRSSQR